MRSPAPLPHLLASVGWIAAISLLFPWLVPALPLYRTCVAACATLLFALGLTAPRAGFAAALLSATGAGASALLFGLPEPAPVGVVLSAAYFAGNALHSLYELERPRPDIPLLPALRSLAVAWGVSALSAFVMARTAYLLVRGVSPPRVVNVLGLDAASAISGIATAAASMAVAAGFHRAAGVLSRDAAGRRFIDRILVSASLLVGGVALAQKLALLPVWRAVRWEGWSRAQSLFTDPSSAGVGAALLLAPLLARAVAGPVPLRLLAALAASLLVALVADAGSRAGLVGALTSTALFLLALGTRVAAGTRPGLRRRLVGFAGGTAILLALGFAAAVSWPFPGASRSPLVARVEASLSSRPSPPEDPVRRLVLYRAGLVLFGEHPFAGGGVGSYAMELPNVAAERLARPVASTDHPPSLYLGVLCESGTAGAVLLVLLLLGIGRGCGGGFAMSAPDAEEALREAGAAAATIGLLVVLLFGSHLVYPEIAALFGVLAVRLPIRREGRTNRFLTALVPVATAGALVVLLSGTLARAVETWNPAAAFSRSRTAGLFPEEREPGRTFRWTAPSAALSIEIPGNGPATIVIPLRNARPDGRSLAVDLFWNDVPRGRLDLPEGEWRETSVQAPGSGVLRVRSEPSFRPLSSRDSRRLGVEMGEIRVSPRLPAP